MPRWTGKHAAVAINGYPIGDLTNWELSVEPRLEEVTAIDDDYTQRVGLDQDIRLRADKFVQNWGAAAFGRLIGAAMDIALQPVIVTCYEPSNVGGAAFFSAPMYFGTSRYSSPDGAVREDVEFLLAGDPIIVPYY